MAVKSLIHKINSLLFNGYQASGFRRVVRSVVLLFVIGFASPLWAISIYDVIALSEQGYGDEDVIKLINSTKSVFELMAEDIPRLKNLGVSESVIRAMLAANPTISVESVSVPNDADDRTSASQVFAEGYIEEIAPRTADLQHAKNIDEAQGVTTNLFAVQLIAEEAAGDHQHAYVTLTALPVLILRDEGRFRSIQNRAAAIAHNLHKASRAGASRFETLHANGADFVVYRGADGGGIPIVTVTARDVHAYDVRSERRVTSDLLAAYWSALLNDYWAITFLHEPPRRLVNLHRGDAFGLLFDIIERTGYDGPADLGSAAQALPGTIRGHLEGLAKSVPADFEELSEHPGEAS